MKRDVTRIFSRTPNEYWKLRKKGGEFRKNCAKILKMQAKSTRKNALPRARDRAFL
jgi:hypothetical protein